MLKRLLLALVILGLFLGTVFGLKYRQMQQAAGQQHTPPPAVVAATEVRQEQWQPQLAAVGSLVATQGIQVSTEVAGVVDAIHFESGQSVAKGAALIDLDADTDRAELKGLQAQQRLAQLKFNRAAKLLPERSMSQADYDEARATLDGAVAAVAAKRTVIDKKHITAPFDGVLGIREVDLGQYLAAGSGIVPLVALAPIYCDFSLPERQLNALAVGQAVQISVQAFPGEHFEGRISALNSNVDVGSRSVRVRATLDNPQRRLRPGMFAEVRVLLPQRPAVLTLPDTAVTYAPYGDSVFLIAEGDQGLSVQRRQIETGETRDGRVEVVSGLAAGERVVSAGQVKLRNGMAVSIDDQPAPGERQGQP